MTMNKINSNTALSTCTDGKAFSTGAVIFLLFVFTLFVPVIAQADGLFDFQMKLAKKGNAEAEFKVGEMYETGFGVTKNMKEATSWITKVSKPGP